MIINECKKADKGKDENYIASVESTLAIIKELIADKIHFTKSNYFFLHS